MFLDRMASRGSEATFVTSQEQCAIVKKVELESSSIIYSAIQKQFKLCVRDLGF